MHRFSTVIFSIFFATVSAQLKCYYDVNEHGWTHTKRETVVTCDISCNYCVTGWAVDAGTQDAVWGCGCGSTNILAGTNFSCSSTSPVKSRNGYYQCCASNYCNGDVPAPMNPLQCYLDGNANGWTHTNDETTVTCDWDCRYCVTVWGVVNGTQTAGWGCGCGSTSILKDAGYSCSGTSTIPVANGYYQCCDLNRCNGDVLGPGTTPSISQNRHCYIDANTNGWTHTKAETPIACDEGCDYCVMLWGTDGNTQVAAWGCGCGSTNILKDTGYSCTSTSPVKLGGGYYQCCDSNYCNKGEPKSALQCNLDSNSIGWVHTNAEIQMKCDVGCNYCVTVWGVDGGTQVAAWGCGCGSTSILKDTGYSCSNTSPVQLTSGYYKCCDSNDCNGDVDRCWVEKCKAANGRNIIVVLKLVFCLLYFAFY